MDAGGRAELAALVRARGAELQRTAYLLAGGWEPGEDLLERALAQVAGRWRRVRAGDPHREVLVALGRLATSPWRRAAPVDPVERAPDTRPLAPDPEPEHLRPHPFSREGSLPPGGPAPGGWSPAWIPGSRAPAGRSTEGRSPDGAPERDPWEEPGARAALSAALAALPRRQRAAVVLRCAADLDEDAVAEALDCSPHAAAVREAEALAALRADPALAPVLAAAGTPVPAPAGCDDGLRRGLHALTSDQPAQPAGRLAAVAERGTRTRRRRAGIAAGLVLAVALGSAVVTAGSPAPTPADAAPLAPTPVGQWPDRSTAYDQPVGEGAVAAWRATDPSAGPEPVRWLFRGVVPHARTWYAAVFAPSPDQVVVAYTRRDQVDEQGRARPEARGPDQQPWTVEQATVEQAAVGQAPQPWHVGLYLPGRRSGDDIALVVGDPAFRQVRLTGAAPSAAQVPLATGAGRPGDVVLTSSDGVFAGHLGSVTGPLTALFADATSAETPAEPLRVPAGRFTTARPGPVGPPAGWTLVARRSGVRAPGDGSPATGMIRLDARQPRAEWTVWARCDGGGQVTVRLRSARGSAPCDGRAHEVLPATPLPASDRVTLRGVLTGTRLEAVLARRPPLTGPS